MVENAVVVKAIFPNKLANAIVLGNGLEGAICEFIVGVKSGYIDVILEIQFAFYLVLQNKCYIILKNGW
jgi:hypothetical protein